VTKKSTLPTDTQGLFEQPSDIATFLAQCAQYTLRLHAFALESCRMGGVAETAAITAQSSINMFLKYSEKVYCIESVDAQCNSVSGWESTWNAFVLSLLDEKQSGADALTRMREAAAAMAAPLPSPPYCSAPSGQATQVTKEELHDEGGPIAAIAVCKLDCDLATWFPTCVYEIRRETCSRAFLNWGGGS